MGKCDKKHHRTKEDARASGHRTTQGAYDLGHYRAYLCGTCRFPDGRRVWHWGHVRTNDRRRRW